MASPSIASYFNVRKRAAADDIVNARSKVIRLDDTIDNADRSQSTINKNILAKNKLVDADLKGQISSSSKVIEKIHQASVNKTIERKTTRRTTKKGSVESTQPKIVKFTLGGTLSPRKKLLETSIAFQSIEKNTASTEQKTNSDSSVTLQPTKAAIVNKTLANAKKELSFDEIKSKVTRSSKLQELKAILKKRQQLEEQYQACIDKRNAKLKANSTISLEGQSLKQFETIELEVLSRLVVF